MKKEILNRVNIVGRLVEKNLEYGTDKEGNEIIRGYIVVRTSDGGEHRCDLYSKKLTKAGTVSKLYEGYATVEKEHIAKQVTQWNDGQKHTLEENDIENCSIVQVNGEFGVQDYLNKEGQMVFANIIRARFVSRVDDKYIETTPQVATFEVGGIIDSIQDEIFKGSPTGSKWVVINHIAQNRTPIPNTKDYTYEARVMFPVRLKLGQDLVQGFTNAGYAKGMFANLRGELFNTVEINEIEAEGVAFGEANVKTFKNIKQYNLIKSGDNVQTIYEIGLDENIANQLIAQRKIAIEEARTKNANADNHNVPNESSEVESASAPKSTQPRKNPFA